MNHKQRLGCLWSYLPSLVHVYFFSFRSFTCRRRSKNSAHIKFFVTNYAISIVVEVIYWVQPIGWSAVQFNLFSFTFHYHAASMHLLRTFAILSLTRNEITCQRALACWGESRTVLKTLSHSSSRWASFHALLTSTVNHNRHAVLKQVHMDL